MKLRITNYELRITMTTLILSFILSGCVVRTYPLTKERVDQDLIGNRGYLQGEAPSSETKERKTTRTTRVVEVEFQSPIKFEKMPKAKRAETAPFQKTEDQELWGNRGFVTESIAPEIAEPANIERYTVQRGDTLQKISKKFYGTSKKWNKIYEANQDKLKGPNKIYPGQTIDIPIEPLKETQENLK